MVGSHVDHSLRKWLCSGISRHRHQSDKNRGRPAYLERRPVLSVECTTAGQWHYAELWPMNPLGGTLFAHFVTVPALVIECLRLLSRQLV